MNKDEKIFHQNRRAFVIIPDGMLLLAQQNVDFSHTEMLQRAGFSQEKISFLIQNAPRGYFMNNTLVFYQGNDLSRPWTLQKENYTVVKKFWPDLKNLFGLNADTKVFLGVQPAKIGEIWQPILPVELDFFAS